jgi:hypothetical protein
MSRASASATGAVDPLLVDGFVGYLRRERGVSELPPQLAGQAGDLTRTTLKPSASSLGR